MDNILPYIRRFHALNYAVVDVNIPSHDAPDSNPPTYIQKPSPQWLENQTKELLCYIWDNFIETWGVNSVVLMGVGDAYLGVKQLLTSRGTTPPSPPFPTPFLHTHYPLPPSHF